MIKIISTDKEGETTTAIHSSIMPSAKIDYVLR